MRSRLVSSLALPAVLLLIAFTPSAYAAQAPVQNRIAGAVNNGSRVALPGTIGGHAKSSTDLGLAPANLKLSARIKSEPTQSWSQIADDVSFFATQIQISASGSSGR